MKAALILMLCIALPGLAAGGEATTVYRSVDEQGVVSFSDTPPAAQAASEAMQIRYSPAGADAEASQRLEQMRETTDRMAADRREREKHRAEMRDIALRQQPVVEQTVVYESSESSEYSGWYYPYSGGYYPSPRPYPPHPGHHPRPPLLVPGPDTEAWSRSHNSQLMRPILPRPAGR